MRMGFQAALVVQMANLSLEQGRRIRWNDALLRPAPGLTTADAAPTLDSVRTRELPSAMRIGFQAALVVQMANLSLEQGRRIRWNDALKKVEA